MYWSSQSTPERRHFRRAHGAWADSSSWDAVVSLLQHDGYTVYVPPNPLLGLSYDSAYIRRLGPLGPAEGLRSPNEESNGYASDLRLGRNFYREVDHFRYVLPGLFRRGARRQVEARAAKSARACSMASGYAWVLSCTASAR